MTSLATSGCIDWGEVGQSALIGGVLGGISGGVGGWLAGAAEKGGATVGRTVLGHFPEYVDKATELGARRFEVPTEIWNRMSAAEQWAANQRFLDGMFARGEDVILATPATMARAGSFFARELQYLDSQGYRLAQDGLRMFKP